MTISFLDDKSTSSGVSKVLWIAIATGAVFLFVVVISICLVYSKSKKANYKINKEVRCFTLVTILVQMNAATEKYQTLVT